MRSYWHVSIYWKANFLMELLSQVSQYKVWQELHKSSFRSNHCGTKRSQQKMSWKCHVTLCLHDFCQLSFFHCPLYFRWCLTYQGSSSRSPVLSEFWPNWTVVPMSRHIFAEIERDEIRLVDMKEVAAVCNYQSWWDHIGTFVTCKTQDKVGDEPFGAKKITLVWNGPKWSRWAKYGPKWSKTVRLTILDPFRPFWNIDKPFMFGQFWSKMDHFWAIPSHERWTPK